jgi:hypothetical protein
MFWRQTRAEIDRFHPIHQVLIWQRILSTAQDARGWLSLFESLSGHNARVRRAKWALPPRTLDVLVPLVEVLCQDVSATGVVRVTADLRGSTIREKIGTPRRLPARPPVRSASEWFTIDPWLHIKADLSDGSVLDLLVVDRIRHRQVRKTSASGRSKTKTKHKAIQLIKVRRTMAKDAVVCRPNTRPPGWIRVSVREGRQGRRTAVTATAKAPEIPRGADQVGRILGVMVEVFRWTRPVPRNPSHSPRIGA